MIRYLDIYLVHGELLSGGLVLVARVLDDVVIEGVSRLHGRGRHVETAAPDLHLNKIKRLKQTLLMTLQTGRRFLIVFDIILQTILGESIFLCSSFRIYK